jgi:hypothetical protein
MERDALFPEPMVHSLIHSYISEFSIKELSHTTGKHMFTIHGAHMD